MWRHIFIWLDPWNCWFYSCLPCSPAFTWQRVLVVVTQKSRSALEGGQFVYGHCFCQMQIMANFGTIIPSCSLPGCKPIRGDDVMRPNLIGHSLGASILNLDNAVSWWAKDKQMTALACGFLVNLIDYFITKTYVTMLSGQSRGKKKRFHVCQLQLSVKKSNKLQNTQSQSKKWKNIHE